VELELVLPTLELELEWSFEKTDGVGVELELKFLIRYGVGAELEWLTPGVAHLWQEQRFSIHARIFF
jgi:hypothetical protein